MGQEFDYQWKNLPSSAIEYDDQRIREFLNFTKLDPVQTIRQKYCLDAGCGNGRYTYAMQKLGAMRVDSFDVSTEAITKCKSVNPNAKVMDLVESKKELYPVYEFVLCWGVLNHIQNAREGFALISRLIRPDGGYLHIMVYNKIDQFQYEEDRKVWPTLSPEEKLRLCEERAKTKGGNVHGWWDALNPKYNHGFSPEEVKKWFIEEGFRDIKITSEHNININGKKGNPKKLDYGLF